MITIGIMILLYETTKDIMDSCSKTVRSAVLCPPPRIALQATSFTCNTSMCRELTYDTKFRLTRAKIMAVRM
jgi:hypothetical protein